MKLLQRVLSSQRYTHLFRGKKSKEAMHDVGRHHVVILSRLAMVQGLVHMVANWMTHFLLYLGKHAGSMSWHKSVFLCAHNLCLPIHAQKWQLCWHNIKLEEGQTDEWQHTIKMSEHQTRWLRSSVKQKTPKKQHLVQQEGLKNEGRQNLLPTSPLWGALKFIAHHGHIFERLRYCDEIHTKLY